MGSFWYRQQNDQYDQVQEGKQDQQPHDPGKFPLEYLLFAKRCTHMISFGRTFSGHKTHSNAQAHWRIYGGATHFHEQRLLAWFTENPFLARFWRSNRLFEHNGVQPDKPRTDGTAYGFVPAPSLSCCSPGGDRYIISWSHHFVRARCPCRAHCRVSAGRRSLLCSRYTSLSSIIIVPYTS